MIVQRLRALSAALLGHGFPQVSTWWLDTFTRFYGTLRRQLVLRCGRRAGKSSTLCRIAVCEALYGEHKIPAGDIGVVAIISVNRDEAAQRIRTIRQILDALGVKYRPIENGLELEGRPVAFKTYAASVSGVSGFTCICAICDEVAKWRDNDTGANPAREVLASLRPTMATMPNARIFLSSSPLGASDAHATAYAAGETDFQCVAYAPTWIANISVTEAETRALEPDEDTWKREYGAIPFDGAESSLFTSTMLDAVIRKGVGRLDPVSGRTYIAAQDPATRANAWALAIGCERSSVDGSSLVEVSHVREWRARKSVALDPKATFREIAGVLSPYDVRELYQDQWSFDTLRSIASDVGLDLLQEPSTATSKVQLFEGLKTRVNDRTIELPDDPQVRIDLLSVRKWITRNGISIELPRTPDGRHSDTAAAVALLVAKTATSTPGWVTAMETMRRNREAARAPNIVRNVLSGEHVVSIPGLPGAAAWTESESEPRFSFNASPEFRRRVNELWTKEKSQ